MHLPGEFLNAIKKSFFFRWMLGDRRPPKEIFRELAKLNPKKIYIENIRSLLDIPYAEAVEIAKEGVAEHYFEEGVELVAPDGTVALTVHDLNELDNLDETVEGWEFIEGDYEPVQYRTEQLAKRTFYRLAAVR
jgi:hypothetical protein